MSGIGHSLFNRFIGYGEQSGRDGEALPGRRRTGIVGGARACMMQGLPAGQNGNPGL
jgi:hypothetical protein